ncbi:MAG: leucyl aminopeptidase family protein, partial [Pseudomonadota bacterium]
AISGNAFRPGDILNSRKGLTVEIGNTDAEGRLVLADALTLACEEKPALLISMATLTGAARVAVGPDLAPYFTDDDGLAEEFENAAKKVAEPVWRLPLWRPYNALLSSQTADMNNISSGPFAGSSIAALFLDRFRAPSVPWMHFDIYAWRPRAAPGRPVGAEVQGVRALFEMISASFS